jgi:isoleucyl-tRNA synthetase
MDRWILSDLEKLVQTARRAFDDFDVMTFCLEAEKYVDDKLSNWYVRRSKRRFWDGDQAAYQTLYTVLTTLAKLCAPVIPFLSEVLYRNLRRESDPESVHLCDYPAADESLIDAQLSADMTALLRLVSLGLSARNAAKIKVRQPLAELRVQAGDDSDSRAVERFSDQLCEELNVKRVTLHDPRGGPLLTFEVRLNMRTAASRLGRLVAEVQAALAAANPAEVAPRVQAGDAVDLSTSAGTVTLAPAAVMVQPKAPAGWSGLADRKTQVLLDTRLTEESRAEGLARDVVRHVNATRKNACLDMSDRIELWLGTSSEALRRAIEAHRAYIAAETLVARWAEQPPDNAHRASVKLDGQTLDIALRKV